MGKYNWILRERSDTDWRLTPDGDDWMVGIYSSPKMAKKAITNIFCENAIDYDLLEEYDQADEAWTYTLHVDSHTLRFTLTKMKVNCPMDNRFPWVDLHFS